MLKVPAPDEVDDVVLRVQELDDLLQQVLQGLDGVGHLRFRQLRQEV